MEPMRTIEERGLAACLSARADWQARFRRQRNRLRLFHLLFLISVWLLIFAGL